MHILSLSALWGALGCYGFSLTALLGPRKKTAFPYIILTAAWTMQGLGLYAWGLNAGACPLVTPFEGYCFLSWAVALLTLTIGPVLRIEALGLLGAGLSLVLSILAWVVATPDANPASASFGFEVHVVLALLACSFFGLLALNSSLALLQDYALRKKRFQGFFENLPSFPQLGLLNHRLLMMGLGLYVGAWICAAQTLNLHSISRAKWVLVAATTLAYSLLFVLGSYRGFWQKAFCWLALGLFAVMVVLLSSYWH